MSALGLVTHTLASAVADDGTVAVAYPTGQTAISLAGSTGGQVSVNDGAYGLWDQGVDGFSFTLGASTITITNLSGVSWPAGAEIAVSFGDVPLRGSYNLTVGGSAGQVQGPVLRALELTATGAIPAGTQSVELNHATVVIAATYTVVPNSVLYIKDTSATGTAAHTVTLTGGTFNGTNTVATFNLRDEFLAVAFDSTGRGQVIANVGTVGLS
jgi:hypothetical protein